MRGFVDLHCHWIAGIDDGARTPADGVAMLRGLYQAGFSTVVATPHMRPGMFENDKAALERAFEAMRPHLGAPGLPEVHLASEHFLDDVVFERLRRGQGLPYPGGKAALVELPPRAMPMNLAARFVDLKRSGLRVVLAHPERYHPVWEDDRCLDPLFDAGAQLLLDVCAIVGKYGKRPQQVAEKLLAEEAYEAACSDAHRPEDAEVVARAIERLHALVGPTETTRLLAAAPGAMIDASSRTKAGEERRQ